MEVMAKFNRLEAKYLIPRTTRTKVLDALRPFMEFDPLAPTDDGTYLLQSLYFDSPTRRAYREKLDGVSSRIKLRSRVYSPDASDDGPVFIEIKRKDGDFIYKDRTTISREEYAACLNDGPFFSPPSLDDPVMREFTRIARGLAMRPAVLVRYHRQALAGRRDKTIRVTFDDQVEALRTDDLFCLEHSPFYALPPDHAVLEIKLSGRLPRWLHHIVVRHDLDRRAISKYLLCVRAASNPTFKLADELPNVHELD
jgi:VTC domain-containing protein